MFLLYVLVAVSLHLVLLFLFCFGKRFLYIASQDFTYRHTGKAGSDGLFQAWEDTYRNWDAVTRYLELYPKVKYEEQGRGEIVDMIKLKRKTPQHANTEHELEV